MTSWQLLVRVRSNDSWASRSRWQRCSQAPRANWCHSRTPLEDSRWSLMVSVIHGFADGSVIAWYCWILLLVYCTHCQCGKTFRLTILSCKYSEYYYRDLRHILTYFGTVCAAMFRAICKSTALLFGFAFWSYSWPQNSLLTELVVIWSCHCYAFGALTLLLGRQEEHTACKIERGVGVVICLEQRVDCIWSSWYHCDPKTLSSLFSLISRIVLLFYYQII